MINDPKLKFIAELELRYRAKTIKEKDKYDWLKIARPKQLPPLGDWDVWMILAGRGFGKSLSESQWARVNAEASPTRGALVGRTPADVRDVMIEGESGILAISPPWNMPVYEPSKRKLTWPNGSVAITYSFENPDQLRGPQHHWAIVDELASAPDCKAWDNLRFGMRLGDKPRIMVGTTPRPTELIKKLAKDKTVALTTGSTYENITNLPESFIKVLTEKYEGTRLGRQEIRAEILEDVEGALWQFEMIDKDRIKKEDAPEVFKKIAIGVDPAITANEKSDETGIIAAGLGWDNYAYILSDHSLVATPAAWANKVISVYDMYQANEIVVEVNQGGDMVKTILRGIRQSLPVKEVRASKGKQARAEPVVALYEQHKIHHVGLLPKLEDQMTSWEPAVTKQSPDRIDALVWVLTHLLIKEEIRANVGRI